MAEEEDGSAESGGGGEGGVFGDGQVCVYNIGFDGLSPPLCVAVL